MLAALDGFANCQSCDRIRTLQAFATKLVIVEFASANDVGGNVNMFAEFRISTRRDKQCDHQLPSPVRDTQRRWQRRLICLTTISTNTKDTVLMLVSNL